MKKIFGALLLLGCVFAGAFYAGQEMRSRQSAAADSPSSSFHPSPYPLHNRPFVVVVIGHNNGAFLEKTLQSIFSQTYADYRVIYIDDASDDGSFELARDLIFENSQMMRVALVKNERRLGTLANLARAVRSCQDGEIVVVVGGEDWLSHEWVLLRLNQYYADSDLWMTYGQYREYPQYSLGLSKPMEGTSLRQMPFTASHLKSFYAGLFKKIPKQEFGEEGRFFLGGAELAYMLPMLEMALGHSTFVPEILYIANRVGKEDRETAVRCEKVIRSMAPHAPLAKLELKQIDPFVEALPE
jgi:glycosyltransferase involved in cell wall biosynthesis